MNMKLCLRRHPYVSLPVSTSPDKRHFDHVINYFMDPLIDRASIYSCNMFVFNRDLF